MKIAIILSFLNFFLILTILFCLKTQRPVMYLGFFVSLIQIAIIFFAVMTRALGIGFTPLMLLVLTMIPAFLPLLSKWISKFRKKKQELNLFQKLNLHLDISFFNVWTFNPGLYFWSQIAFTNIEKFLREKIKTPHIFLNKILIFPWILFLSVAVFEILFFRHSYVAPILLGLNLLIYRITLILVKIIEKKANENLQYIYFEFFQGSRENEPTPYFIRFVREETLISILDNNNENSENVINKCIGVISANFYASAVLQSKILKNYLLPLYFTQLNRVSSFVLLLIISPSFFNPFFAFLAISSLSNVFFETKYLHVNQLIYHLLHINKNLWVYRNFIFKELSEIDANVSKLLQIELIQIPIKLPKPKTFKEFFTKFETFSIFPENYEHKSSLGVLLRNFCFKSLVTLALFVAMFAVFAIFSFLTLLNTILWWVTLF